MFCSEVVFGHVQNDVFVDDINPEVFYRIMDIFLHRKFGDSGFSINTLIYELPTGIVQRISRGDYMLSNQMSPRVVSLQTMARPGCMFDTQHVVIRYSLQPSDEKFGNPTIVVEDEVRRFRCKGPWKIDFRQTITTFPGTSVDRKTHRINLFTTAYNEERIDSEEWVDRRS